MLILMQWEVYWTWKTILLAYLDYDLKEFCYGTPISLRILYLFAGCRMAPEVSLVVLFQGERLVITCKNTGTSWHILERVPFQIMLLHTCVHR